MTESPKGSGKSYPRFHRLTPVCQKREISAIHRRDRGGSPTVHGRGALLDRALAVNPTPSRGCSDHCIGILDDCGDPCPQVIPANLAAIRVLGRGRPGSRLCLGAPALSRDCLHHVREARSGNAFIILRMGSGSLQTLSLALENLASGIHLVARPFACPNRDLARLPLY
jgi:hypothetical protein